MDAQPCYVTVLLFRVAEWLVTLNWSPLHLSVLLRLPHTRLTQARPGFEGLTIAVGQGVVCQPYPLRTANLLRKTLLV